MIRTVMHALPGAGGLIRQGDKSQIPRGHRTRSRTPATRTPAASATTISLRC